MSLISRLGRRFRDKPGGRSRSPNLNLPGLPTAREILEDIENLGGGGGREDPVIALATLIQKKGKGSLLDKDFLEEPALQSGSPRHLLTFLSPYQNTTSGPENEDSSTGGGRRGSLTGGGGGDKVSSKRGKSSGGGGGGSGSTSEQKQELLQNYNKLKQFLLLVEKSDEILEGLEPHFHRVGESLQQKRSSLSSSDNPTLIPDNNPVGGNLEGWSDQSDVDNQSNSSDNPVCSVNSPLL